jgi:hypothetical protein
MIRHRLAAVASALLLPLSGCAFFRQQLLLRMQAQHAANHRLALLVEICLALLPVAVWAGMVWGTKSITLRSWRVLLAIEVVLIVVLAIVWKYLAWIEWSPPF